MSRRDQIIGHYKKKAEALLGPEGTLQAPAADIFGSDFQILGINPNTPSKEEVRGLCVGLTFKLVHRGMNRIFTSDYVQFLDGVGKLLLAYPSKYFGEVGGEPPSDSYEALRQLFVTTLKLEMSEWSVNQNTPPSWSWPVHRDVGERAFSAETSSYLVYPLLEAVAKRLLKDWVSSSGKVIKEFSVPKKSGCPRKYKARGHVSAIGDLLLLICQESEFSELGTDLGEIFKHIEALYPDEYSATSVIYQKWRNPAMHGEQHVPTATGVVLNIVILLAIASIPDGDW